MKTLPEPEYQRRTLNLTCVLINSQELIEVCAKIDKLCGNVSIVKEKSDRSRILVESLEDINDHIAIIRVPFEIVGKDISVEFSNLGVAVRYRKTDEVAAHSIFATLKQHSPVILNYVFRSAFVLMAFGVFVPQVVKYFGDTVPVEKFPNLQLSDFFHMDLLLPQLL